MARAPCMWQNPSLEDMLPERVQFTLQLQADVEVMKASEAVVVILLKAVIKKAHFVEPMQSRKLAHSRLRQLSFANSILQKAARPNPSSLIYE